jgi:transposase
MQLMWLTARLTPDFKTIANFRKNNSKAIRSVCRQFVVLGSNQGSSVDIWSPSTAADSRRSPLWV